MSELKKVLMDKGMSAKEADEEMNILREEMYDCIDCGDYDGAEDVLLCSGIDLDYVFDLLI